MQRIKIFVLFGAPLLSFVPLRGEVIVKDLERLELFTINSKPHTMCRKLKFTFHSQKVYVVSYEGEEDQSCLGRKGGYCWSRDPTSWVLGILFTSELPQHLSLERRITCNKLPEGVGSYISRAPPILKSVDSDFMACFGIP